MRAIDRLRAACSMAPVRKSVELPDGTEFEYWHTPLTIAQRSKAQQAAGDDTGAFAVQLFVMKATDESGSRLFADAEAGELSKNFPSSVIDQLLLQLLSEVKDDEAEGDDLAPKPLRGSLKKTQS